MFTAVCYLFSQLRLGLPLYFRVVDPLFFLPYVGLEYSLGIIIRT